MSTRSHLQLLLTPAVRPSILGLALLVGITGNAMTSITLSGQVFSPLTQLEDLTVIDDGDEGFSEDQSVEVKFARAHGGDFRYMVREKNQTADTAARSMWTFSNLEQGTYEAYATWVPFGSNNTQLEYVITEGESRLGSMMIDQRSAPADATFSGTNWKNIGTFNVSGDAVRISIVAGARFSIVDAVGIRKIDSVTQEADMREAAPIQETLPEAVPAASSSSAPTVIVIPEPVKSTPPQQESSRPSLPAAPAISTSGVRDDFRAPVCGNSFVDRGEDCDDGNFRPGDGCSITCTREYCGDGMVSGGEECEIVLPNAFSTSFPSARCSTVCRWEYCGDGIVQSALGETCDDRNKTDKDGCARTCRKTDGSQSTTSFKGMLNTDATLAVVQKSIGLYDTTVRGSKNLVLLRFEARAGARKDVLLETINFYTGQAARNSENFTLVADSDNDAIPDRVIGTAASADANGFVEFRSVNQLIGREKTVVMEVHGDITASPLTAVMILSFPPQSYAALQAQDAENGAQLTGISFNDECAGSCSIFMTTAAPKAFTIRQQGSLFISSADASIEGSVLNLSVKAQDEGVDITTLQITSLDNNASSVERLELFKEGAVSPFAVATAVNCGTKEVPRMVNGTAVETFCATMDNSELVVFANQEVGIHVRAVTKELISPAEALPLRFFIASTPAADELTGRGAVHARGLVSGFRLVPNNGDGTADGEIFIGTAAIGPNQDIAGGK